MALTLIYPQISLADNFTSATVLEWDRTSQNALFQNSVTMIGIVATQTGQHGEIAECINEWYWEDGEVSPARNEQLRDTLALYPEHHPQVIVLAVVQKACGSFDESAG